MADTLVFRLHGVAWHALAKAIRAKGPAYAEIDADAAWGAFGGYPAAYRARRGGVRLRGLNLGKQQDGSVLVNALLLYGPFEGAGTLARGRLELSRVVRYLRGLPGLERATLGGSAARLYVRESRHFLTRCRLTVDDALGNLVPADTVAAGDYPLDVQTLSPSDDGYVYGVPEVYGARLCVTLPATRDNLWLVGKTAGYDPLAAASARVVPFGMALGEAVGVAAARAAGGGVSAHTYAKDGARLAELRQRLLKRGAYLPPVMARAPSGPYRDPAFGAYRTLRRKGLALGGYNNDPQLGAAMPARGFLHLLANVGRRFWHDGALGTELSREFLELSGDLTPSLARDLTRSSSRLLGARLELPPLPTTPLTRGDAYRLAATLAEAANEGNTSR